jgi:hypothetical protein
MSMMLKRMMMLLMVLVVLSLVVAPVAAVDFRFDMQDGGGSGEGDPSGGDGNPKSDDLLEPMLLLISDYDCIIYPLWVVKHFNNKRPVNLEHQFSTYDNQINKDVSYELGKATGD